MTMNKEMMLLQLRIWPHLGTRLIPTGNGKILIGPS